MASKKTVSPRKKRPDAKGAARQLRQCRAPGCERMTRARDTLMFLRGEGIVRATLCQTHRRFLFPMENTND